MTGSSRMGDEIFATVLAAAQGGAGWAYTRLWEEYASAVAGFLSARGSRESEDLTSEVFLVVFDRLAEFRGDAAGFRSFIFSIAYRRLVDELRMRRRRGETVELLPEEDPRRASSAESEALERVATDETLKLLRSLTPDQRDVMILRIVADLTVEQVAEVLGKRPDAIKALQRRALTQLRKKMGDSRTPVASENDSEE